MSNLVQCSCGVHLRVPDRGAVVRLRCPRCKAVWDVRPGGAPQPVPAGPPVAAPPPARGPAPPGTVGCACGAFLRVPANHTGLLLRCPKCGAVWDVPPPPRPRLTPEEEWAAAAPDDDTPPA